MFSTDENILHENYSQFCFVPPLPLINVGKLNSSNAGAALTMPLRITQSPQYVDRINHYFNNILLPTLIQGERGEHYFNRILSTLIQGERGDSIISIKYSLQGISLVSHGNVRMFRGQTGRLAAAIIDTTCYDLIAKRSVYFAEWNLNGPERAKW